MEQSKQGFIYRIVSPSGKIYVGQTKNIKNREKIYRCGKCKTQPKLYNSIQKYGWDIHIFEIIDQCSIEIDKTELNEKEKYWIKFYDSHHNGLNCNDGGQGHLGRKQSSEHIAKRVAFLKLKGRGKGKKISEETIKKRIATKKKNNKTIIQSIIHISKRVLKNKGQKRTEEQLIGIRAAQQKRRKEQYLKRS